MATSSQSQNELPPPSRVDNGLSDRDWRTKFSDRKAAVAWVVSAGLGAVLISTVPPESGFLRFFVPVAIMVSYVWLHYPRGSFAESPLGAVRIAQLADSAYFLGFLWTLWALIDSFVLKKATIPEAAFRVFGYALVTTAAGMTIRLFLLHFQITGDVEVYTVEENLQRFSAATDKACGAIQGFQESTDALNNKIAVVTQTVDSVDKHVAETHRQTTKAIGERINTTVDDLRSKIAQLGDAVTAAERGLSQAHRQTSEALSGAVVAAVKETFRPLDTAMAEYESAIRGFSSKVGQLGQAVTAAEHGLVDTHRQSSEALSKTIVATLEETRRPLHNAIAEYESAIRGFTANINQHSRVLADAVQQSSLAISQATSAATDSVSKIIKATGSQISSENLKAMEQMRAHANQINDELRRTADAVRVLQWETRPQVSSELIQQLIAALTGLRQGGQVRGGGIVERPSEKNSFRKRGIWRRLTNLFQR